MHRHLGRYVERAQHTFGVVHIAIEYDLEMVQAADRAGFKYVWATEHHFLDEYSHLSANEVVLAYLGNPAAATLPAPVMEKAG